VIVANITDQWLEYLTLYRFISIRIDARRVLLYKCRLQWTIAAVPLAAAPTMMVSLPVLTPEYTYADDVCQRSGGTRASYEVCVRSKC
jgi:hypothetical protein